MSCDAPRSGEVASSSADTTRPLPVLRAMIDAIDHEVLQLLARRNGLVAEVAQYKRLHRKAIRDPQREQTILADRRRRCVSLGLSPDLIESIYRLVLWGSRDRQAALRAELPLQAQQRTVALIGGRGAMGTCLASLFGDLGHAVMIADLDTTLTPEEAASAADVVVIAVPMDRTTAVIRKLGPLLRDDALLMDVTSIKQEPMAVMLDCCRAGVVGTHPLFAPTVHSLQGQRVVLTRGRGDEWFDWVQTMFGARGLVTLETTPEAHDRAMAVVQVLVHFSTEVMGLTLSRLHMSLDETLTFTSPVYLIELLMTARHFAQSPDLYASIGMSNPATGEITSSFLAAARHVADVVSRKDHERFAEMFDEVQRFFGSFTDHALEQSTFLIDRLVERT